MRHPAATIDPPAQSSGISVSGVNRLTRFMLALVIAFVLGGTAAFHAFAQATPTASPVASPIASGGGLDAAVAWLLTQQDAGGGFLGFTGEPDAGVTIDAVLAIASVPNPDQAALTAAAGFLIEHGLEYAAIGPGQAAKLTMAAVALGQDPAQFGLIDSILGAMPTGSEGESGFCGFGPFDHALCLLGLVAADAELPAGSLDALIAAQLEDGGWSWDANPETAASDSNTTAFAIQALIASGVDAADPVIQNALAYLATVIDPEQGGFAYDDNFGLIADANSTGAVIHALIAAGEDASSDEWGRATDALAGFQNASGAFRFQHEFPDDNLFATVQAIPAMAGVAFPIIPE
ncbi:MAG: cell wall anchor protein [Thermomicrobiales bacterium]|nr:cell wall anchor protein [Thermomicrobiales bacterium]